MEKKIYFITDLHLGVPTLENSHQRELKLVRFLDSIKDETEQASRFRREFPLLLYRL